MVNTLFLLALKQAVKTENDWRVRFARHVLDFDGLADVTVANHAHVAGCK